MRQGTKLRCMLMRQRTELRCIASTNSISKICRHSMTALQTMYKNTATYKNATQLEYEIEGIRNSTVFAKESEALPEICLSGAPSASTLSPLLGSGDGNEKLPWSPMSRQRPER